jgi:hypothetical protein
MRFGPAQQVKRHAGKIELFAILSRTVRESSPMASGEHQRADPTHRDGDGRGRLCPHGHPTPAYRRRYRSAPASATRNSPSGCRFRHVMRLSAMRQSGRTGIVSGGYAAVEDRNLLTGSSRQIAPKKPVTQRRAQERRPVQGPGATGGAAGCRKHATARPGSVCNRGGVARCTCGASSAQSRTVLTRGMEPISSRV